MYDKTELLNTVSVLKTIPLKPILTLLHSEFYVWKSIITLKLFKGNISFIIYDEWLSNATVSQKFRSSLETNIQNKEIYWKSEHVLCYIIRSQYICFFLFTVVLGVSLAMLWLLSIISIAIVLYFPRISLLKSKSTGGLFLFFI